MNAPTASSRYHGIFCVIDYEASKIVKLKQPINVDEYRDMQRNPKDTWLSDCSSG